MHPREQSFPDETAPSELLRWVFDSFPPDRIVVTTAFGMEGCVLIDLVAKLARPFRVHFVDTGFLFPETHALRSHLEDRYPLLRFESAASHLAPEAQELVHGPALWRRDPDRCCELRKIEPMRRLLAGASAWITAIRREQSPDRASTALAAWDARWGLTKIAPLAAWSRPQVLDYVVEHDVPVNELHFRGYPSIGCVQCTRPVDGLAAGDYSRAGRWADHLKTECGLHRKEKGR